MHYAIITHSTPVKPPLVSCRVGDTCVVGEFGISDNVEVIAKPLRERASRPQITEKYGQDVRVPGKA